MAWEGRRETEGKTELKTKLSSPSGDGGIMEVEMSSRAISLLLEIRGHINYQEGGS